MSRSPEDWKDERMKCLEARKLIREALGVMDEYNLFHNGDERFVDDLGFAADRAISILNTLIGMNTIDWDGEQ